MKKDVHLLIDGYNIIHAWPDLKSTLNHFDSPAARALLADSVRVIHDTEGIRTTIVFDGRGRDTEIERPHKDLSFSFLFSSSNVSADTIIEQLVSNAKKNQSFIVVSDDILLLKTVSALGATTISSVELKYWVARSHEQQSRKIQKNKQSTNKQWKQQKNPWNQ